MTAPDNEQKVWVIDMPSAKEIVTGVNSEPEECPEMDKLERAFDEVFGVPLQHKWINGPEFAK